jgi:hypothetical protein
MLQLSATTGLLRVTATGTFSKAALFYIDNTDV